MTVDGIGTSAASGLWSYNYTGPNKAKVDADNQNAVAGGLNGGFNLVDILTDNDKKLVGYNGQDGKINTLANALATYRYNGSVTGEVTPDFINKLKQAIATTGGYPANPSTLLGDSSSAGSSASLGTDAVQKFMDYMKKTPAQRMEEDWLNAHGISQAQFDSMSAADKKKIMDEMKADIEAEMKRKAEAVRGSSTDLLV